MRPQSVATLNKIRLTVGKLRIIIGLTALARVCKLSYPTALDRAKILSKQGNLQIFVLQKGRMFIFCSPDVTPEELGHWIFDKCKVNIEVS